MGRRHIVPALLCAALLLVPLFASRPNRTAPTAVEAGSGPSAAELRERLAADRASRGAARASLEHVVDEATTTTLPPETTTTVAPATTTTTAVRVAAAARPKATTTSTTAKPKPTSTTTTTAKPRNTQTGEASWYDAPAGTCAHRTLPMGTIITVTRIDTGKSIRCRVADRGPFNHRVIDLSRTDFSALAPPSAGVIDVRLEW